MYTRFLNNNEVRHLGSRWLWPKSIIIALGAIFSFLVIGGCQSSPCRPKQTQPPANLSGLKVATQSPMGRVWVYEYDGSSQCQQSPGQELSESRAKLRNINVFEQRKVNDGLMRAQMCGVATGMANVFLIPSSDYARAVKLGFKLWTFDSPE